MRRLDYGGCRLSIAVPNEMDYQGIQSLEGKKVATTYPYLLERYFKEQSINAKAVMLQGSVEVAPRAGVADAICDLVSTGATLEANGLVEKGVQSLECMVRTHLLELDEKLGEKLSLSLPSR